MSAVSVKRRIASSVAARVVAAVLTLCANRATAQTNSPSTSATLSLADARRLALERNWDLLAAKSGMDAASAQWLVTREFPNPTAALSTAKLASHDEATSLGNSFWNRSYDTIVAVSQLIEIGGKRRARQTAARQGMAGAKARFYDAERSLDQGVTKAYLAAALAGENARILTQSSGYMGEEARIAKARFQAGDLSDVDSKQILINAEQYELQARSAEAAAAQARVQVELLLGVSQPRGAWTPSDALNQLVTAAAPAPAASGPGERPDVMAAEADLRSSEANLRLQRAGRIPDPTFSVQYEHDPMPPGPPPPDTFGVGISFPLPVWNQNTGNIRAAEAARDQAEDALGKARAQAASDLANARIAYEEARARWQRYESQIGPQASQALESVSFAYKKGAATLVDLLEAERADNDARLATAQAMADTASAAADLAAAQTVVTESTLMKR